MYLKIQWYKIQVLILLLISVWEWKGFIKLMVNGQRCDPISQRLFENIGNQIKISANAAVCPLKEFCKVDEPPTDPPIGNCAPKGAVGTPCTTNVGCDKMVEIESRKIVCSIRPGSSIGKCGCSLDYLNVTEKSEYGAKHGLSYQLRLGNSSSEIGCFSIIDPARSCNPETDVCSRNLVCRSLDTNPTGSAECYNKIQTVNHGAKCYDISDCIKPFVCHFGICRCIAGFKLDTASNTSNCISDYAGFKIKCTSNDDCDANWNVVCSREKVCDCPDAHEYFQQLGGQDRCYPTRLFGFPCNPKLVLTKEGTDHDCRRKNSFGLETGLYCLNGLCDCEKYHFKWNVTSESCKQLYGWYNDPCDNDSLTTNDIYICDERLFLTCNLKTYKCECKQGGVLLGNKMRACQRTKSFGKLGDKCDNMSASCIADLNLGCKDNKCDCIEDKSVIRIGKRCIFNNTRIIFADAITWQYCHESLWSTIVLLLSVVMTRFCALLTLT